MDKGDLEQKNILNLDMYIHILLFMKDLIDNSIITSLVQVFTMYCKLVFSFY